MTAADRTARQKATDAATKPDRIEALRRDLTADIDYYQEET